MPRKSDPIKQFRRELYKTARILGDVTAVWDGKIERRIFRSLLGKYTSKTMKKIFKSWW